MKDYTLKQFQEDCVSTAIYGDSIKELIAPIALALSDDDEDAYKALDKIANLLRLSYTILGLCGEVGEAANKMKKAIRDKNNIGLDEYKEPLKKELISPMWYIATSLFELDSNLNDSALELRDILRDRKKRGKIKGDGDDR